jgi:hypothetical protein
LKPEAYNLDDQFSPNITALIQGGFFMGVYARLVDFAFSFVYKLGAGFLRLIYLVPKRFGLPVKKITAEPQKIRFCDDRHNI